MEITDQHPRTVEIRAAQPGDVAEMVRLFAALGYAIAPDVLAARFAAFDAAGERALVATRSAPGAASLDGAPLLGLATLHVTPVLHRAGPVGRVTALVVDAAARGQGIGRALMDAAEAWAATRGCVLLEVTSNRRRTDAHAFYERVGYEATSYRFAKTLALLACTLLAFTACSVERRGDESGAARDSSVRAPISAAASPPAAAVTASSAPAGPDADVRAVCAAAAAAWRAVPRATLRELDTLLTMHDVIEDPALDTAPPPGAVAGRWPACAVEGFAEAGLDSTLQHPLYWPAAGWVVFPRLTADGPGAQVQVYQRGWLRCQVAEESDGGDDGDTAYVPSPFHRERTLCWRHGRLVAPQDTIDLGG